MTDKSEPKTASAQPAATPVAGDQGPAATAPLYAAIVTLGQAILNIIDGVTAAEQAAISAEVGDIVAAAKQQLAK